MKIYIPSLFRKAVLLLSLTAAASVSAFQYNNKDVLLGFRQVGGASFELVVNAGSISNFLALPNGTTITVSNVVASQLMTAFPDLNGISWSVASCVHTLDDVVNYPLDEIWVTSPRGDLNTQTTPWIRRSQFGQANQVSKIDLIGNNAVQDSNIVGAGTNNTATGIIIATGSGLEYSVGIGAGGNYNNFQGVVEMKTPDTFDTDGQPVRSDFYQLLPDSSNTNAGTYLGYFEFHTNGVMTYTAGTSSIVLTPSTITSIVRSGTTNIVSFTTSGTLHYRLCFTNSIGLLSPVTTWPVSGLILGTGSPLSLDDITSDADRFYRIQTTP